MRAGTVPLTPIPLTPVRCLYRGVDLFGRATAIVSGTRRFSYAQYGERCERLAAGLASLGVRAGDRVAWLGFNSHQLLEAYYGAPLLGAILLPLNVRLHAAELEAIVHEAAPRVLVFDEASAALAGGLRSRCPSIEHCVSIDGAADGADLVYEDVLARDRLKRPDVRSFDEHAIAEIFYTSGSTGRPRGVQLSHRALYLHALDLTAGYHLDDTAVELLAVPLFHANGWGRPHSSAMNGITQVVLPRFDAARLLALVQAERVTWVGLVPAMAQALLEVPGRDRFDLSSLQCLHLGGAPCPTELAARLETAFDCRVLRAYGLTETAPGAVSTRRRRTGASEDRAAGWPLPGCEVRVVDRGLRDAARDGREVGEIVIRGDHVMSGYYGDPGATAAAFTPDGWLLTGDLGVWDADGNVRIVDRRKDVIISGGENISSAEIEEALLSNVDVSECGVVAAPDETWGEVPAAVVVLKPGSTATVEDLRSFLRERVAGFKVPKIVEIVPGPLPRTGTGKVAKQALRDRFR